ncbi:MAG: hypothetical protein LBE33_06735 [Zoogloeaceae bacterium]|nr:hypothetical protein [Zoogloeaceae bacterium]
MRSIFTPCLLVAASLMFLPAAGAQEAGGAPATDNAAAGQPAPSREELAEAKRLARAEQAREQEKERLERERECVIKPVMTNAEIAHCKKVWR